MVHPEGRATRGTLRRREPLPGRDPEDPALLEFCTRVFRLRDLFCLVLGAMALLLPGPDGRHLLVSACLLLLVLPYNVALRLVLTRRGHVLRSMAWADQVFAAGFLLVWPELVAPAMVAGILDVAIAAVMLDRRSALRGATLGSVLFSAVVLLHHVTGGDGNDAAYLIAAPAYVISALTTAYAVGTVASRERSGRHQLSNLLQSLEVVIYEMDASTLEVLYVSPHVTALVGGSPEDYLGDPGAFLAPVHRRDVPMLLSMVEDLGSGRHTHDLEYRLYDARGELRWIRNIAATDVTHDGRALIRGTLTDITRQKTAELALETQASTDPLTGLPNRARLLESIAAAPPRLGAQLLVFLDVDSFKRINDSLGHRAGDALLVQIASRLTATLRTGDVVGRMGGDEYVVLSALSRPQDAAAVVSRLLEAFSAPFDLDGRSVRVTASAGAVVVPAGSAEGASALLEQADVAMYSAKRRGPGQQAFFTTSMRTVALERLDLEGAIRTALEQDQFHLVYQPIVLSGSHDVVGYEALVRWDHPAQGVLGPMEFIPVAEQTGQIVDLGRWVLRAACADARRWQDAGAPARRISVNLSAVQLTGDSLVRDVAAALAAARLPASALCLEITETALIANPEAALVTLTALRATGVTLSLDDFGTGFSSLSHLHRYPVDEVKIDKSFVAGVGDGADRGIVTAILHLAHHMGLTVVAEGVETLDQAAVLSALGCDLLQGYALGRPARVELPSGPSPQLDARASDADLVGRLG